MLDIDKPTVCLQNDLLKFYFFSHSEALILPTPIHPMKNPPTDIPKQNGKVTANTPIRKDKVIRDPVEDSILPNTSDHQ